MAFPSQTLFMLIAVLLLLCPSTRSSSHACHPDEHQALLAFRAAINDSHAFLTSWVRDTDCCEWDGITCDNLTNHVVELALYGYLGGGVISQSVCHLHRLQSLELVVNGLKGTLPPCLGNLSHLQQLQLYSNDLSGGIPASLCSLASSLVELTVFGAQLSGRIPSCLGNLSSLESFDVSGNQLAGSIPSSLGGLSSLKSFDVSDNQLTGSIPSSLGGLSSLKHFDVSYNQLTGTITSSLGGLSSLEDFEVSSNNFSGNIPSFLGNLSSLIYFSAYENDFSGIIPSSFARLSSLHFLYASNSPSALPSSIEALGLFLTHNETISETVFSKLSHLIDLDLEDCVLNISTSWIPSFQLSSLYVDSCKMNGQFPLWISTQFSLAQLSLTGNNLVGEVPSWVWDTSLEYIDFSNNQLQGNLFANTSMWMGPSNITFLALNDNLLSGNIPPVLGKFSKLNLLNLANNNFTGNIPPDLASCSELHVLHLGNNGLNGRIPCQFGKLSKLFSLELSYNKLEGSFPHSITNCSNLEFLDVAHNSLEGSIPKSIRHLPQLRVLVLRENHFGGAIPPEIGQLMKLQILDLSSNGFSGSIPQKMSCLKAMANASHEGFVLSNDVSFSHSGSMLYQDGLYMISKGLYLRYVYIYSTFTVINLSNNRLSGEVPSNLGDLKGLRQLNLSMNNLSSSIPDSLGEMSLLESLDLSTNRFSGKIPWMLDSLNNLGVLNLANNNLSGSIPQGSRLITFAEPSYSGNPYLWGCPLPKNCSWPQYASPPSTSKTVEAKSIKIPWYGIALGLSYGAGFGGTVTLIAIFYQKYFEKVDLVLKLLFPWLNRWIV